MVLEKLDTRAQKRETRPSLYLQYTNINQEKTKDLCVRPDTMKVPEEHMGKSFMPLLLNSLSPGSILVDTNKSREHILRITSLGNMMPGADLMD